MSQSRNIANAKSILVVDDEPLARTLLRLILVREGYEVHEAQDGYDALEKLAIPTPDFALENLNPLTPDLIILDVMMPGIDGFEVCERLQKDLKTADIPIFMLSAKNDPAAIQRSQEVGAKKYLIKPISPRDLVDNVRGIIG